jgi:predicted MPP superfamily phosphohydrolase
MGPKLSVLISVSIQENKPKLDYKKQILIKRIPSIAILHDPKNNDVLINEGVSLVVSGHTHCGQFWPFSILVKKIYRDKTYGVRQIGDQATTYNMWYRYCIFTF